MKNWKLIFNVRSAVLIVLLTVGLVGCGGSGGGGDDPAKTTVDVGDSQDLVAGNNVSLVSKTSGSIVSYLWEQTSGDINVTIVDGDTATASFVAPTVIQTVDVVLRLTVTDSEGAKVTDEVVVTIYPRNPDPVAEAGPERIGNVAGDISSPLSNEIIFFDGSASTGSNFIWTVESSPAGSMSEFTSSNTQTTGFYANVPGEYSLKLSVNNSQGVAVEDTLIVTLIADDDGDGISNADDLDRDGDGFLNSNDVFPDEKASHLDTNGDGVSNYKDNDVDGDGIDDVLDDFPLDANKSNYVEFIESNEASGLNQNDGVSVAEIAGNIPLKVAGKIFSTGGAPDLDYYELSWLAGQYSVVFVGADQAMNPSVTVIDASGRSIPTARTNFITQPGVAGVSVRVATAGTYYLVVTDASGQSDINWDYEITVLFDTDMDGLSDELEQAIDSNHLTSDSDGDGITDYIEYQYALKNWAENKDSDNDGNPVWWDTDSDGDSIPDRVEYYTSIEKPNLTTDELFRLNDIDNDAVPNFVDVTSDGGTFTNDFAQVGGNPLLPIDTDKDGVPDFLDLDNDGDGISDIAEGIALFNKVLVAPGVGETNLAESLLIKSLNNLNVNTKDICRAGDTVSVSILNAPATAAEISAVFNTIDGALVQTALSLVDDVAEFVCPDNIEPGLVEFYLATATQRSGAIALKIQDVNAPVINDISYNSATREAIITGENLNVSLNVMFNGASVSLLNQSGNAAEISVIVPAGVNNGYVAVATGQVQSNGIWLNIQREISGQINLSNNSVDVTKLDVSLVVTEEVFPAADGSFTTDVSDNNTTTLTALLERPGSTEESPQYGLHLSAIVLPDATTVDVSANSTALALTWDGLGVAEVVAVTELSATYARLEALDEVVSLGVLLSAKLAADPFAIADGKDSEIRDALLAALSAGADMIAASNAVAVQQKYSTVQQTKGLFGTEAVVQPVVADDISVYERGDTGNVTVKNDTQLYLSTKITTTDGAVVQKHITGLNGMAGPQGYGLLFWASSTDYKYPGGKNAVVEIVSPGIRFNWNPKTKPPMDVWKKLYMRTTIERVILPVLSEVLPLPKTDFVSIIWGNAPGLVDIVVTKAINGDASGSIQALVKMVLDDFATVPPGPITKAIAAKLGQDFAEKALAKIAAKIGAKFVPGVGQIQLAYEVAGAVNTGANVANAIIDIGTTDSIIHFDVIFPLTIDGVTPNKVIPDGSNKSFVVTGSGFSDIKRGFWPFESYLKPEILITDADSIEAIAKINSISPDGTSMNITIPGWYLIDTTNGPLDIEIHHPIDEATAKVEKLGVIEIVLDLELSSISPAKGGVGISATVYGAGFSTVLSENEITIGGAKAIITSASESAVGIIIPSSLNEGMQSVVARVMSNGIWSDPSNALQYEVQAGKVAITVCDNGSAKDDAFALYLDGLYIGTMYATNGDYCDVYNPNVNIGDHAALLLGVEAPDSIGTYSISFSGVSNLTGDVTSGTDLTPGIRKLYNFSVSAGVAKSQSKAFFKTVSYPFVPTVGEEVK